MEGATPSKIDLRFSESKVVFSICDCSLGKGQSFYYLDKEEASKLIKRLQHLQKMTWRQLSALSREDGLTTEIVGFESYNMIDAQNTSETKLVGERYYFHFRVEKKGLFRVFGYQMGQLFCITHIDPKGKIQHP